MLPAAMTTIHNTTPTKSSAIAAHRYGLPIVREISPVAATARDRSLEPTPSSQTPCRKDAMNHDLSAALAQARTADLRRMTDQLIPCSI
jgi:hypothetical protein